MNLLTINNSKDSLNKLLNNNQVLDSKGGLNGYQPAGNHRYRERIRTDPQFRHAIANAIREFNQGMYSNLLKQTISLEEPQKLLKQTDSLISLEKEQESFILTERLSSDSFKNSKINKKERIKRFRTNSLPSKFQFKIIGRFKYFSESNLIKKDMNLISNRQNNILNNQNSRFFNNFEEITRTNSATNTIESQTSDSPHSSNKQKSSIILYKKMKTTPILNKELFSQKVASLPNLNDSGICLNTFCNNSKNLLELFVNHQK